MGYTHYWEFTKYGKTKAGIEFTQKLMKETADKFKGLVELDVFTDNPGDGSGVRIYRVNGVDDDAHETFSVHPSGSEFNFCKTARKPYDQYVATVLYMLYRGGILSKYSSDDFEAEDMAFGKVLFKDLIWSGYGWMKSGKLPYNWKPNEAPVYHPEGERHVPYGWDEHVVKAVASHITLSSMALRENVGEKGWYAEFKTDMELFNIIHMWKKYADGEVNIEHLDEMSGKKNFMEYVKTSAIWSVA